MDDDRQTPRFRPNPKRQAILVALALFGLAVGYGLGFLFKRPQPQAPPPPVESPQSEAPREAPQTAAPAPVLPQSPPEAPTEKVRAYEEALPKEIVVVMQPITDVSPEPVPAAPTPTVEDTADQRPEAAARETAALPTPPAALSVWRRHALKVPPDGRPRIAIVMDDLGVDRGRTRRTLELPGPLTLSFMTYARDVNQQAAKGRARGHEIWLHVPMEPSSENVDPGPNVLLTGMSNEETTASLRWSLDQLTDYVGINNHMGSRFTADMDGMRSVMAELKRRDLAFLDSVTSAKSAGYRAAREAGIPFTLRNVFIDHEDTLAAINAQLEKVEKLARKQGYAIAIGHPREATLRALAPWLETLDAKGFQLVPASTFLKRPD